MILRWPVFQRDSKSFFLVNLKFVGPCYLSAFLLLRAVGSTCRIFNNTTYKSGAHTTIRSSFILNGVLDSNQQDTDFSATDDA